MKTNIKIRVKHDNIEEVCRVKLDSQKFPYIVVNNDKIIINNTNFPRSTSTLYGLLPLEMELITGQEELELILSNPELTIDKVSLKQLGRLA